MRIFLPTFRMEEGTAFLLIVPTKMKRSLTFFERVNYGLLLMLLTTIVMLILRLFLLAFLSSSVVAFLAIFWRRGLYEESIIHFLKQHDGVGEYEMLVRDNSEGAIHHLERQGIIRVDDQMVTLVNRNYICIFDKFESLNI